MSYGQGWLFLGFTLLWATGAWAAPQVNKGKVTEVTLYRGEAQVTRTISIEGAKGAREVVVTELPAQLIADSLFAEGNAGVMVRAVRYRVRRVQKAPHKRVRILEARLEALGEKLRLNKQRHGILEKQLAYLKRLETFVIPSARSALSKGSFAPEKLIKMSQYLFTKRAALMRQLGESEKERQALHKQLRFLRYERSQLTQERAHTVREASIFLEKLDAKPQKLRLNYRVRGCGWSPLYQVRGNTKGKTVRLEYNALVTQKSGEDWQDVTLRLSTAEPSLSATAPGLAPLEVQLASGSIGLRRQAALLRRYRAIRRGQSQAHRRYNNVRSLQDNERIGWQLNDSSHKAQMLELNIGARTLKWLHHQNKEGGAPTLNYQVPQSVSLPSRSQGQMVRIMQHRFKAKFYYLATPVLSNYVHREAELLNESPHALLKGPVTVYLNHRYVGRTELPTITQGQTFHLGFGADPHLRTTRKLAKKTATRHGGNKVLSFVYTLRIENYKKTSLPIRMLDRVPYFASSSDVTFSLNSTSIPLSNNKRYAKLERPQGILRWDTKVPAKSHGERATQIEYSYTLTFDRKYHLSSASKRRAKQNFFKLQRRRWRY